MSGRDNRSLLLLKAASSLLVGSLLTACASVSPPDGGERDTQPPKLLVAEPADQSTNISAKVLRLTFDEDVVAKKDLQEQLLITPTPTGTYRVREEGRSISLVFQESFSPNTTYSFDFRQGIADATEGNQPAKPLQLAFSTGAILDSGAVTGKVVDLLTDQPRANVLVGLWEVTAGDSLPIEKAKPYYQTLTDATGSFRLSSVRNAAYWLFAIQDKNKNSQYNPDEAIAYRTEKLNVTAATPTQSMRLGVADKLKPFVVTRKEEAGKVTLQVNEGLTRFRVEGRVQVPELRYLITAERPRQVQLFAPLGRKFTKQPILLVDSAGNAHHDSLTVAFGQEAPAKPLVLTGKAEAVGGVRQVTVTFPVATDVKPGIIGQLTVQAPVGKPAAISPSQAITYPADAVLDSSHTRLTILITRKQLALQATASLRLDSTAFGPTSAQPIRFTPIRLEATDENAETITGSITGKVTSGVKQYWLELLNEKYVVLRTLASPKEFRFESLEPGTYHLRARLDENGNGRWQGADPDFRVQPEAIWFYPQPLKVRANWEQEVELAF